MADLDNQVSYWDDAATTKRFTHPLHNAWTDEVGRDAAIVDYGCGYGRTMADLGQLGFTNLTGFDIAPAMIAEARAQHPAMRFAVLDAPPRTPLPDASIDMAFLFAVLTCIPGDEAQQRLVDELDRVLKPGGLLYLSDLLLGDDPRSRQRYDRYAGTYGTYGVFKTDDGAICRHHPADRFPALLAGFDIRDTRRIVVTTMNGNRAPGIQILAAKPVHRM